MISSYILSIQSLNESSSKSTQIPEIFNRSRAQNLYGGYYNLLILYNVKYRKKSTQIDLYIYYSKFITKMQVFFGVILQINVPGTWEAPGTF